jgi:hypothetical protein
MIDYTYFAREHGTYGPVKIGRSSNVMARLGCISTRTGKKIDLICAIPFDCEHSFHQKFAEWHRGGEWFEWSYLMQITLNRLMLGTFDFASLPPPKKIVGSGRHGKAYIGRFAHSDDASEVANVA